MFKIKKKEKKKIEKLKERQVPSNDDLQKEDEKLKKKEASFIKRFFRKK